MVESWGTGWEDHNANASPMPLATVFNTSPTIWITPTGHNDPSNDWADEAKAYDDDTGTYATCGSATGSYLELTHAELQCDRVRVNCCSAAELPPTYCNSKLDIDVDVYYGGAWHNIHSGTVAQHAWETLTIGSTEAVTKMRIKANAIADSTGWLHEADFGVPPDILSSNLSISERQTLRVTVQLSSATKFYAHITRSGTSKNLYFNENTDLSANSVYAFDLPVRSGDIVNFRIDTEVTVDVLNVERVRSD